MMQTETPYVVRLATLRIHPKDVTPYADALRQEIETSLRVEPGVLALHAVAEKDNPAHITILEIYRDAEAYHSHLESPHFRAYKAATQDMIASLQLMETVPIFLSAFANAHSPVQ